MTLLTKVQMSLFRTPVQMLFAFVAISVLFLIAIKAASAAPASVGSKQTDGTVIAYVSSSVDSQEIRIINSDGTGDQLLWRVPNATHLADGIALGGLSWHPDATELAFDSGHDWQRSMHVRDLYSVTSDGQTLRRISRPPSPEANGEFTQGTVRFTLDMIEQGDVQLYVEGMDAPFEYFARLHDTWAFTVTLADFGENQRQYIRVWDPDSLSPPCNFSEEGWVDVIPNTVTDIGIIDFSIVDDHQCPVLFSPSWTHDGSALNYLYREATTSIDPETNLWQIPHSPQLTSSGTRLLNMNNYVSRGKPYRIVSGPTAATADDLFFLETGSLRSAIYYAPASNADNHTFLDWGRCPETRCDIHDIEWIPDGTGILFSRYESGFNSSAGVIIRYDFESQQFTEILRLAGEPIGNLSISPDGNTIVFEHSEQVFDGTDRVRYGPRLQCPCALWLVDMDGSNVRLLTEDGRQPAWSPTAPSVAISPTTTPSPAPQSKPTPASPTPVGSSPNLGPALWLPYIN